VVLNLFIEGSQIQIYDFVRESTKKILTQVNSHVLFYCRMKSVTQNIRSFIHRHSHGGLWGHSPP